MRGPRTWNSVLIHELPRRGLLGNRASALRGSRKLVGQKEPGLLDPDLLLLPDLVPALTNIYGTKFTLYA